MAQCRYCFHARRDEIDHLYIQGTPLRTIIANFGGSLGAASRHRRHVARVIKERCPEERAEIGSDLLQRVTEVTDEAKRIVEAAKAEKSFQAATMALNTVLRSLELIGKLTGEIAQPVNAPGIHLSLSRTTITNVNANDDAELASMCFEGLEQIALRDGFDGEQIARLQRLAVSVTVGHKQARENKALPARLNTD